MSATIVSGVVAVGRARRTSARTYREFRGVVVQVTAPDAGSGRLTRTPSSGGDHQRKVDPVRSAVRDRAAERPRRRALSARPVLVARPVLAAVRPLDVPDPGRAARQFAYLLITEGRVATAYGTRPLIPRSRRAIAAETADLIARAYRRPG